MRAVNGTDGKGLYMRYVGALKLLARQHAYVPSHQQGMIKEAIKQGCRAHPDFRLQSDGFNLTLQVHKRNASERQLTFVDVPRIPHPRPLASREGTSAAAGMRAQVRGGTKRAAVLHAVCIAGLRGRTDEEVAMAASLPLNTARPRRYELEGWGLVRPSGMTRRTSAGSLAIVWRVTLKGFHVNAAIERGEVWRV